MDYDALRALLLGKPGAHEDYPFGPETMVIKVGGKMFALMSVPARPVNISLKCDPYHGQVLREEHAAIQPGYHLNKRHWITATLDGSLPDDLIESLVNESYSLVVNSLTRAERARLSRASDSA